MINGLYETHIQVSDLERSVKFYKNILGLEQCHFEAERRIAFFWMGKKKQSMLGLWETPKEDLQKRHFAFECTPEFVLNESVNFLKKHNLKFRNFLGDDSERPMVFAWMPAAAIYFDDPDGNALEFIGILEGESRPELGVISYEEWIDKKSKNKVH